jgi:hypothetical protein
MVNRRDIRRRSEVFARVVAWVRAQTIPVSTVPVEVADPSTAARILRQLAMRGLVRHLNAGWLPSIILVRDLRLVGDVRPRSG